MQVRAGVGVVLVGALALVGCGDDDESAEASTFDAPSAGNVLFEDALDSDAEGWGTVDNAELSLAFEDGDYVWSFHREPRPHVLPRQIGEAFDAGTLEMRDVVVRASATADAGSAVFGVFCREVRDDDAEFEWYEMVVRDGFGAIRRADSEGNLDELASSDEIVVTDGEPVAIEAACVDGDDGAVELTLSLDGKVVLQASDGDGLGNGGAGLGAYEAPHPSTSSVIRWHDFSVAEAST